MGTARGQRLGGALAAVLVTTGFVALLASGGCELVVGDSVPSFTCLPGTANNCPAGQVCVPSTQQCVPQAGTCTPGAASGCGAGLRCDEQTLRCTGSATVRDAEGDVVMHVPGDASHDGPVVTSDGPISGDGAGDARDVNIPDAAPEVVTMCRTVTCPCSGRNSDCDSGVCAGMLTETMALANALGGMNFCTQPCCTSGDCPGNTVCFGTGGGGNYCVAPQWIGRAADQGTALGGATCANSSECRSGLCTNNQCADTCCSSAEQSSQCASPTVCRYAAFPGSSFDTHVTAWCGTQAGTGAGGTSCGALDSACQSGKCTLTRCEAVCRSSTDCSSGQQCSYGAAPATLPTNKDIIAGCMTAGAAP
jgi:hypothetical protein